MQALIHARIAQRAPLRNQKAAKVVSTAHPALITTRKAASNVIPVAQVRMVLSPASRLAQIVKPASIPPPVVIPAVLIASQVNMLQWKG